MKKVGVSIIVPVYNVEKYIDKCLNSLVNQTFDNYEIVIINDGSPDNSEDIINKYINDYPELIKYKKIKNGGVANARNVGLDLATGEYIGFVDSDDYVELHMFESMYDKAKETNADIVTTGYYFEKDIGELSNRAIDDFPKYGYPLDEIKDYLYFSNPFITTKIFSKKMLDKYNIRFHKYKIFEDLLFTYSSFIKANKIENVNESMYHYIRRKGDSVTGSLNKKFYDIIPVMKKLKEYYKENSKEDYTEELTYVAIHHSFLRFKERVGIKKLKLKYKYIKDIFNFLDEFNPDWRNNVYFEYKNMKSSRYKKIMFWMLFPYGSKIKNILKKVYKLTARNYGHYYSKCLKKKINNYSVLFDSQKGNDINGNMFYLLKEMRNNKKYDNYKAYVCVTKERIEEFKNKLNKYNITDYELVVYNSRKYIKVLATAKYLFNDTSFPTYFIKRDGQVYLNTWHGTPLKYLGRSVEQEYFDISNVMKNFLSADYILYPNKFMRDVMIRDYMLNDRNNKVLLCGYPRNTIFKEEHKKEDSIQRIAYLPTWRGTKDNKGGYTYVDELEDILSEIDKGLNDNQEFYLNMHPYLKGKVKVDKYKKIKLFDQSYETYDFLSKCDVLITDYSSVFFDYANSGNKIILFPYDEEIYLKERGMYLDIKDFPFPRVYDVPSLIKEINNTKKVDYKDFTKKYCAYDSKDNAKKVLELVINNNKKDLILEDNTNRDIILLESNNYNTYNVSFELLNILNKYKDDNLYLGFTNSKIRQNKVFLKKINRNINFYGNFSSYEFVSLYNKLLLKLLQRNKNVYNRHKKRFDKLFRLEYARRYKSIDFSKVIVYKDRNLLNTYLYSYNKNDILVINKIPNVNEKILSNYSKIITDNKKTYETLSEKLSNIEYKEINKLEDVIK